MKLVLIGGLLFFFTFSAWAGEFLETFNDAELGAWDELIMFNIDLGPGSWEIVDGGLQAVVRFDITRLLTMGDKLWGDYDIEYDVKPLKKHGPGNLAIAARITGTWAVWCVIGDTPAVIREGEALPPERGSKVSCWGGDFQDEKKIRIFKSKPNPLLKLNKWSTLKLSLHGDNLSFWINGEQVLKSRVELPNLLRGKIGLGLAGYTARFDNIAVIHKDELPVKPWTKLAVLWGSLKRL